MMRLEEPNSGHGHIRPRPDGVRARCLGPMTCRWCLLEAEILACHGQYPALAEAWEDFMIAKNNRITGAEHEQWKAFRAGWDAQWEHVKDQIDGG